VLEEEFRKETCKEVVRMLSNARNAQGLSMNRLAKLAGLTQGGISFLEASQPNPKLENLLKLARALGLNLGDILKQAIRNVEKPRRSSAEKAERGSKS